MGAAGNLFLFTTLLQLIFFIGRAFSATEQIETDTIRLTGRRYILAPQQIVSCDIYGIDSGLVEEMTKERFITLRIPGEWFRNHPTLTLPVSLGYQAYATLQHLKLTK